jgi:hypothetical protein
MTSSQPLSTMLHTKYECEAVDGKHYSQYYCRDYRKMNLDGSAGRRLVRNPHRIVSTVLPNDAVILQAGTTRQRSVDDQQPISCQCRH